MQATGDVTLGIIAGGRATRLGGRDKAWIVRDGHPQVLRIANAYSSICNTVLVSANRDLTRYSEHGLRALVDRMTDIGPLGALDALSAACTTPWLFTLPVDSVDPGSPALLHSLLQTRGNGAVLEDDDGLQPLVALYQTNALRVALAQALNDHAYAVQGLQACMQLARVRIPGLRLGNLNTPADLQQAGCE